MATIAQQWKAEGRIEGIREGKIEGRVEERFKVAERLLRKAFR